jgi:hypothetical protein
VKPRRAEVLAAGHGNVIGTSARPSGMSGRGIWTRATADLEDELEPIVRRAVDTALGV